MAHQVDYVIMIPLYQDIPLLRGAWLPIDLTLQTWAETTKFPAFKVTNKKNLLFFAKDFCEILIRDIFCKIF